MEPLTDDEAALLTHITRWGSDGYPIEKLGRKWVWRQWRGVKGSPVLYKTKKEAVAVFELWQELVLERWRQFRIRMANPNAIMTATGVSIQS